MLKNIVEKLDSVGRALERQNEIVEKLDGINQPLKEISAAVAKPKDNKFIQVMEIAVLFVSVFGIIQLIDHQMDYRRLI